MTTRPLALLVALAFPLFTAACDDRTIGDKVPGPEDMEEEAPVEEEEELPASHKGEPCEGSVGQVQPCSVGQVVGVERCAWDSETYENAWSACFTEACEAVGASRGCAVDGGGEGLQFCLKVSDELLMWGECGVPECVPGQSQSCGFGGDIDISMGCSLGPDGVPRWNWDDCNTPLVLAFDGEAPTFVSPVAAAAFDVTGAGACESPEWPTAATPWLALDRDRSGTIDGGHELFGNGTRVAAGGRARNGFEALADLDADGDRRITPADPAWAELVVWADHDGDRRSTAWELVSVEAMGLVAIELDYALAPACDGRGNCAGERAAFTFRRGDRIAEGAVIDVYLACQ